MPRLLALSSLVLTVACSDASEPPAADAEPTPPEDPLTSALDAATKAETEAIQQAVAAQLNMHPGERVKMRVELSPNTQTNAVAWADRSGLCVAAVKSPRGQWLVTYMGTTPATFPFQLSYGARGDTWGHYIDRHEVNRMFDRCLASNSPRPG